MFLVPLAMAAGIIIGLFVAADLNFTTQSRAEKVNPPAEVLSMQKAFVEISEKTGPAVVYISTEQSIKVRDQYDDLFRYFFGDEYPRQYAPNAPKGREYRRAGLGTGMIIDANGYILTNYHVVKDMTKITVTLASRKSYEGEVIGVDKLRDLAVIKIDAKNLPTVVLGDSENVRVGEWVLAIGNPFGYDHTITAGIVSAKGRLFESGDEMGVKRMPNLIQTDAAINPGNSGGPLVNIYGEVIGINTAISSPLGANIGIGFAIPINEAKKSLPDMMKGKKMSEGTPWVGVSLQDIDDKLAKKFNAEGGVLIANVIPHGPGHTAGLKPGDIIVAMDGGQVKSAHDLQNTIASHRVGDAIVLKVLRKGKEIDINVKLAAWGSDGTEQAKAEEGTGKTGKSVEWLGMKIEPVSMEMSQKLELKDRTGVIVTEVKENSAADKAGIQENDIIRAVDNAEVSNFDDFQRAIKNAKPDEGVLLFLERGGNTYYKVISQ